MCIMIQVLTVNLQTWHHYSYYMYYIFDVLTAIVITKNLNLDYSRVWYIQVLNSLHKSKTAVLQYTLTPKLLQAGY